MYTIALAATGFIWVRYSLVITPVNYSLAAVRDRSISTRRVQIAYPYYIISLGKLLRRCLWVEPVVQDIRVRL
jgi:hypothetical protein